MTEVDPFAPEAVAVDALGAGLAVDPDWPWWADTVHPHWIGVSPGVRYVNDTGRTQEVHYSAEPRRFRVGPTDNIERQPVPGGVRHEGDVMLSTMVTPDNQYPFPVPPWYATLTWSRDREKWRILFYRDGQEVTGQWTDGRIWATGADDKDGARVIAYTFLEHAIVHDRLPLPDVAQATAGFDHWTWTDPAWTHRAAW